MEADIEPTGGSHGFKESLELLALSTLPVKSVAAGEPAVRISEERISAVEDVLVSLKRHRNSYLPIISLPNELLLMIFSSLKDAWPRYSNDKLKNWVIVTHVCSSWREIAIHEPMLWKDVNCHIWPCAWINHVMFPRSAKSAVFNLTISFEIYEDSNIPWSFINFAMLPHNVSRLRELHLIIDELMQVSRLLALLPPQLPLLEKLSITIEESESRLQAIPGTWIRSFAPNLRSLTLGSCSMHWREEDEASLPASITRLILYNGDNTDFAGVRAAITDKQLQTLMESLSSLEYLSIQDAVPLTPGVPSGDGYLNSPMAFFATSPTIQLPRMLKRLHSMAFCTLPGHLFSRLIIPPTTIVDITIYDNSEAELEGHIPHVLKAILGRHRSPRTLFLSTRIDDNPLGGRLQCIDISAWAEVLPENLIPVSCSHDNRQPITSISAHWPISIPRDPFEGICFEDVVHLIVCNGFSLPSMWKTYFMLSAPTPCLVERIEVLTWIPAAGLLAALSEGGGLPPDVAEALDDPPMTSTAIDHLILFPKLKLLHINKSVLDYRQTPSHTLKSTLNMQALAIASALAARARLHAPLPILQLPESFKRSQWLEQIQAAVGKVTFM